MNQNPMFKTLVVTCLCKEEVERIHKQAGKLFHVWLTPAYKTPGTDYWTFIVLPCKNKNPALDEGFDIVVEHFVNWLEETGGCAYHLCNYGI